MGRIFMVVAGAFVYGWVLGSVWSAVVAEPDDRKALRGIAAWLVVTAVWCAVEVSLVR